MQLLSVGGVEWQKANNVSRSFILKEQFILSSQCIYINPRVGKKNPLSGTLVGRRVIIRIGKEENFINPKQGQGGDGESIPS